MTRRPEKRPFAVTFKVTKPEFEKVEQSITGTPEERQKAMKAYVTAKAETIAVEIMGEKGRQFVAKVVEKFH